jgi:hypothetical protein
MVSLLQAHMQRTWGKCACGVGGVGGVIRKMG